jgi:toxin-antitoxin system PIN domain toxin
VTQFLLDVNVLIALHSPHHKDFHLVHRWFEAKAIEKFATCAITQAGFVRISAQIFEKPLAAKFTESRIALTEFVARPGHTYWPMDVGYLEATEPFKSRMHGHRQITDAFLLGLALHHGGKLATLDRAILHVAGPEYAGLMELIG